MKIEARELLDRLMGMMRHRIPDEWQPYVEQVEESMKKFTKMDETGRPMEMTDAQRDRVSFFVGGTVHGSAFVELISFNEVSPIALMVRARIVDQMENLLQQELEHMESGECTNGVHCAVYLSIDSLIINSHMPPWVAAEYAKAHIRDCTKMTEQARVWRNLRSITAEDGVQ